MIGLEKTVGATEHTACSNVPKFLQFYCHCLTFYSLSSTWNYWTSKLTTKLMSGVSPRRFHVKYRLDLLMLQYSKSAHIFSHTNALLHW